MHRALTMATSALGLRAIRTATAFSCRVHRRLPGGSLVSEVD